MLKQQGENGGLLPRELLFILKKSTSTLICQIITLIIMYSLWYEFFLVKHVPSIAC